MAGNVQNGCLIDLCKMQTLRSVQHSSSASYVTDCGPCRKSTLVLKITPVYGIINHVMLVCVASQRASDRAVSKLFRMSHQGLAVSQFPTFNHESTPALQISIPYSTKRTHLANRLGRCLPRKGRPVIYAFHTKRPSFVLQKAIAQLVLYRVVFYAPCSILHRGCRRGFYCARRSR